MKTSVAYIAACCTFVLHTPPQQCCGEEGQPRNRTLSAEILHQEILAADGQTLKSIRDGILTADLTQALKIKFSAQVADRYLQLSEPDLAVAQYRRALTIPHKGSSRQKFACAQMWSVAIDSLLIYFYKSDQLEKIIKELEERSSHGDSYCFDAVWSALRIKWEGYVGSKEKARNDFQSLLPRLIQSLPERPTAGDLLLLNRIVGMPIEIPVSQRMTWLEAVLERTEQALFSEVNAGRFDNRDVLATFVSISATRSRLAQMFRNSNQREDAYSDLIRNAETTCKTVSRIVEGDTSIAATVTLVHDQFLDRMKDLLSRDVPNPMIGTKAPDFSQGILSSFGPTDQNPASGDVIVLDFWAIWCGACINSFPRQIQLCERYRSKGVRFVGVTERFGYTKSATTGLPVRDDNASSSLEDEEAAVISFTKSHKLSHSQWIEDGSVSRALGISVLPTVVVIDRKGVIREVIVGASEAAHARLDEILEELTSDSEK